MESTNSMKIFERYHTLIYREFTIIKSEAPDIGIDEALHIALKEMNDLVGLEVLCPS